MFQSTLRLEEESKPDRHGKMISLFAKGHDYVARHPACSDYSRFTQSVFQASKCMLRLYFNPSFFLFNVPNHENILQFMPMGME